MSGRSSRSSCRQMPCLACSTAGTSQGLEKPPPPHHVTPASAPMHTSILTPASHTHAPLHPSREGRSPPCLQCQFHFTWRRALHGPVSTFHRTFPFGRPADVRQPIVTAGPQPPCEVTEERPVSLALFSNPARRDLCFARLPPRQLRAARAGAPDSHRQK